MWNPDIVIYHDQCADGMTAAWACWKRWPKAKYVPARYGMDTTELIASASGAKVLMVDFSFKRDVLLAISAVADSIVILDHHETAEKELEGFDIPPHMDSADFNPAVAYGILEDKFRGGEDPIVAIFDMHMSGAALAWRFAHGAKMGIVPEVVALVEDRDLWRFNYKNTKPFALWLRSEPLSIERIEDAHDQLDYNRRDLFAEANGMQKFFDAKVQEIAQTAWIAHVCGHAGVAVVNCPPMFASEVGHALLDMYPDAPFAAMFNDQKNTTGWSLRSRDDRVAVSDVARKYGGGGHRNAAGFGVPR